MNILRCILKKAVRFGLYLSLFLVVLAGGIYAYLQLPQFAKPEVHQAQANDHFADGFFHNVVSVPVSIAQGNRWESLYNFLFKPVANAIPSEPLPSQKTDLLALAPSDNVVVWMGHSSYFMQLDGATYLIDPVFSHNASPVPYTNVAFAGTNIYSAEDLPSIDYLLISHDHWDHLDYPTLKALQPKIKQVVTPLGLSAYFEQWGYTDEQLFEGDWYNSYQGEQSKISVVPAQHFSGRMLTRNQTLWAGFVIETEQHKVFYSGDTGYSPHFKDIGQRFGAFDVAILEAGQYDPQWPFIHMSPEEAVQAANDVNARLVLAAHNSKFKLARHTWYDPLERVWEASQGQDFTFLTPLIGQTTVITSPSEAAKAPQAWWRGLW